MKKEKVKLYATKYGNRTPNLYFFDEKGKRVDPKKVKKDNTNKLGFYIEKEK